MNSLFRSPVGRIAAVVATLASFRGTLGSCSDAAFVHRRGEPFVISLPPSTEVLYRLECSTAALFVQSKVQRQPRRTHFQPLPFTEARSRWTTTLLSSVGADQPNASTTATQFADSGEVVQSSTSPSIVSPVLEQVYPALLQHVKDYGHPNIPLGSSEGRQCATLRRLRTQEKLVASDVALLDGLQFYWHSLEDVYQAQKDDFDDLLQRLQVYAAANDGDVSPPKKYAADPELGAWVTALRRLYPSEVDASHIERLDAIGFQWTSPRQCGSKFMQMYRQIQERLVALESTTTGEVLPVEPNHPVWDDPAVIGWVQAQQEQVAQLSETRKHYLAQLVPGPNWLEWKTKSKA
jgi:Helicase associated domain